MDNETAVSKEQVFSYSQDVVDEIRKQAVEKAKATRHEWRQKGIWVYCRSCDNEHGFYVGVKKQLVGVSEDGKPILIDR